MLMNTRQRLREEDGSDVLTLDQAAQLLKLSRRTLTRLASSKEVPGRKFGSQWRFSRKAILALLPDEPAS